MTITEYTDNILSIFADATPDEYREGMTWYNNANAFAWELDWVNPRRAAGIIAVLSPLISWEKNKDNARRVYAEDENIPYIKKNVAKAYAILNGWNPLDVVSGPKVTAFYHNIVNPYSDDPNHVTIDKHAADICLGYSTPYENFSRFIDKNRDAMAIAYVDAAHEANILPLQMQAITWTAWRNMKSAK